MIRAIRPSAMAQDDAAMISGWNVAPNLAYTVVLLPGSASCGVMLYGEDGLTIIGTGAALVGTAQPCVLIPQSGQTVGMVDADLGWHLLLTTTGTESQRTIRIGPAVDLPDEIHPVYGDDDMALARATAAINAAAHYIDDVTVTCQLGLGAGLGDVVSVPVDGVAVVGQVESVTWTATPDGATEQAVIRRHVVIAPESFVEITPPTVADDTGTATHAAGTSGNVLTNDATGLTVVAVNGMSSNVGIGVDGDNGGTFVLEANGVWTFDPDGDFALLEGTETADTSVTYHASDGTSEAMAMLTVTVSRQNTAPVAVNDTGETDAVTTTSGNVLTNDTDADLDTLTVSQVAGSAANVGVAVDGSSGGLFTVNANGAWTFDPDGDFAALTGSDTATTSVTYHVSDGRAEAMGTLTVTVSSGADPELWTPAQITTALWLDAADSATITLSGSKVTQWSDKSGNGRHVTQGTDSVRPSFGTNKVVFGGSHWLNNTSAQLPLSDFVCGIVFKENSVVANSSVLSIAGTGADWSSTNAIVFGPSNKTSLRYNLIGSSGASFLIADPTSPGSVCPLAIYTHYKDTSVGRLYINGSLVSTDNSFNAFSALSAGGFALGARRNPAISSPYLNGEIMEIVYATSADLQKIEGYLAHKWDALLGGSALVGALPSDHPYKSAPPTI